MWEYSEVHTILLHLERGRKRVLLPVVKLCHHRPHSFAVRHTQSDQSLTIKLGLLLPKNLHLFQKYGARAFLTQPLNIQLRLKKEDSYFTISESGKVSVYMPLTALVLKICFTTIPLGF